MLPPWAIDEKLAQSPVRQCADAAAAGAAAQTARPPQRQVNRLKIVGHMQLATPPRPHRETKRAISGQWVPDAVLGPTPPQRSRFSKEGGIFLEGEQLVRPKKVKLRTPSKLSSESKYSSEESVDLAQFEDNEVEIENESADEGEKEPEIDFEAMERERLEEEALEAERDAQAAMELIASQLGDYSDERIETAKKLMSLENLMLQVSLPTLLLSWFMCTTCAGSLMRGILDLLGSHII